MNITNLIFLKMDFSNLAVYKFLFFGLLLFASIRILKFILPILFKGRKAKIAKKYFSFTELVLWVLFMVWALHFFATNNPTFEIGLFVVMIAITLWASFFFLKDYFVGVMFKTGNDINLNEVVEINGIQGKIIALKNRTLRIENETGSVIQIPYSKLLNAEIKKEEHAENIRGFTFQLEINKKHSLQETMNKITIACMNLPWASLKKKPQIKPIEEDKDTFKIDVTVFSLEKKYFYDTENYLRTHFEKN